MTSLFIKMDVIRCPVSAFLKFRGTKLSRMAVEPRKPRKFSTAKIMVHTVHDIICFFMYVYMCVHMYVLLLLI